MSIDARGISTVSNMVRIRSSSEVAETRGRSIAAHTRRPQNAQASAARHGGRCRRRGHERHGQGRAQDDAQHAHRAAVRRPEALQLFRGHLTPSRRTGRRAPRRPLGFRARDRQPYAGSSDQHSHDAQGQCGNDCGRHRRASEASLRRFLHGLPGVDQVGAEARAAGLGTRSIKTTAKA